MTIARIETVSLNTSIVFFSTIDWYKVTQGYVGLIGLSYNTDGLRK